MIRNSERTIKGVQRIDWRLAVNNLSCIFSPFARSNINLIPKGCRAHQSLPRRLVTNRGHSLLFLLSASPFFQFMQGSFFNTNFRRRFEVIQLFSIPFPGRFPLSFFIFAP